MAAMKVSDYSDSSQQPGDFETDFKQIALQLSEMNGPQPSHEKSQSTICTLPLHAFRNV